MSKLKQRIFTVFYLFSLLSSLGYWCFINYQFYSSKGNGAGSEWINEAVAIDAYAQINQIYRVEKGPNIVFTHHKQKSNEGLVTNYAFAHTCNDYDKIVKQEFQYSKPVVLILTMPVVLNETEVVFLKNNKHQVLKVLTNEQLIRINLS